MRLWRCDLTGANLSNSKLRAFVLAGALLRSTNLTNTSFVDDPEPLNQILMLWSQDADAWNAYRKQKSRIVLSGCIFNGAQFPAFDLSDISLTSGYFIDADLSACTAFDNLSLIGARLQRANLRAIKAFGLKLQRANLSNANCEAITLDCADLSDAIAHHTNFTRANLSNTIATNLQAPNASFDHATLHKALFSSADLSGASFKHCAISASLFSNARLQNCTFENTSFTKCSFAGTDLTAARFIRCTDLDLSGAHNAELAEIIAA